MVELVDSDYKNNNRKKNHLIDKHLSQTFPFEKNDGESFTEFKKRKRGEVKL